jgi:uncharacterized protein (DUF4415 family)
MTAKKILKEFVPGQGYTKEDWDDAESPPLTKEQIAQAKPFAEVFPDLAETMRKNVGGRPPLEKPKQAISIRLDPDVVAKFKATGKGWQSRVNDVLKKAKLG